MSQVLGVCFAGGEIRQVPKLALNFEEVGWCLGSPQLAMDLRKIEALVPVKKRGRVLLFDALEVAEVWARYKRGDYDAKLKQPGGFEA